MTHIPRSLATRLVLLVAMVPHGPAVAADDATDRARRSYEKAETAYALGKFEEALKHYEESYEAKNLPALLFNIGQCHRNLGNWERATFFYQGYLSREPNAPNRSAVLKLISRMDENVRAAEERVARGSPGPPPEGGRNVGDRDRTEQGGAVPDDAVVDDGEGTDKTPVYKRWWLWVAVGAAVAVAAVATVTAVALNPTVDDSNLFGSFGGPIDAR